MPLAAPGMMQTMNRLYEHDSLQFLYPDGWELDETRNRDGLSINLQSPYSMFVFVNCYDRPTPPAELAEEALRTMAEEYEELDANPVQETIADRPAVGHDVNFFSLDLTNTCWIRALSSGRRSLLVFAQTNDLDLEQGEMAFRTICASLKFFGG